jgi:hypothetical protein
MEFYHKLEEIYIVMNTSNISNEHNGILSKI